jgi:hypothetical protein
MGRENDPGVPSPKLYAGPAPQTKILSKLVTTPTDALECAVNFPDSVRKSASILQVLCKPYHDLLSFPTAMQAIDMMTLQKKTRVLQGLWERSQQISKQIADVEYILLNPQQFAQVNEAVLRTGKAQLEHQLEEVNDQANFLYL